MLNIHVKNKGSVYTCKMCLSLYRSEVTTVNIMAATKTAFQLFYSQDILKHPNT